MCPTSEQSNERQGQMKPDTQQGSAWLLKTLTDALKLNSPQSLLTTHKTHSEAFVIVVYGVRYTLFTEDNQTTLSVVVFLRLHHASKFTNTAWDIRHIREIRLPLSCRFCRLETLLWCRRSTSVLGTSESRRVAFIHSAEINKRTLANSNEQPIDFMCVLVANIPWLASKPATLYR